MSEHNAEVDARAIVVRVLRAEGGDPGNSLHSWRCEYPDHYGKCDCLEQTADEILAALRALPADGVA